MLVVRAHGAGQGEMFDGLGDLARTGQCQAQAEQGVVLGGVGLHDHAEVLRGLGVPLGTVLGARERLADAARRGLGGGGVFENLDRRLVAAAFQKVQSTLVPVVHLTTGRARGILALVRTLNHLWPPFTDVISPSTRPRYLTCPT